MVDDLEPGDVVWAHFDPTAGREQGGRRPAVVVSGVDYLEAVTALAIVVPVTSVDRGWPNHVSLSGDVQLTQPSWAMTEQPRAISRERLTRRAGSVSPTCLDELRGWIAAHLDLAG
jgi:mRNA interferase MazF